MPYSEYSPYPRDVLKHNGNNGFYSFEVQHLKLLMDNERRPTCIAMGQLSDSTDQASGKTKVKGFNISVLK